MRRARCGHNSDDPRDRGQRGIVTPFPGLEADVRREKNRRCVSSVHGNAALARRAARGDNLELTQQMIAGQRNGPCSASGRAEPPPGPGKTAPSPTQEDEPTFVRDGALLGLIAQAKDKRSGGRYTLRDQELRKEHRS